VTDQPIPAAPRVIDGARALQTDYDAWFCDIWGVLHNGQDYWPAAVDAAVRFRRDHGGRVILITNAPRPHGSVAAQLETLGIDRACYDRIVTSGDVTRALIADHAGGNVYHLGPERDRPIFAGIDVTLSAPGEASAIVNTGLFDDITETPDDYRASFNDMVALGLPMICANPDIVVERGTELCYCAGALAQVYEELGGTVLYAGKPHRPIYELCMAQLADVTGNDGDPGRVLAIGDGLKTDMPGAAAFGIDSLFIPSGIHVSAETEVTPQSLAQLFSDHKAQPVAALPGGLRW